MANNANWRGSDVVQMLMMTIDERPQIRLSCSQLTGRVKSILALEVFSPMEPVQQ